MQLARTCMHACSNPHYGIEAWTSASRFKIGQHHHHPPTHKVRERSAEGYLGRSKGRALPHTVVHPVCACGGAHPASREHTRLECCVCQTGRKSPGNGAESASPRRQDPSAQSAGHRACLCRRAACHSHSH
eukprot:1160676-Pelagomonas_calceolata.AAC.1